MISPAGRDGRQDHSRGGGEEFGAVVFAEREDVQAQMVCEHRVAKDLGHPVHRPVRASGALVALQVAERQDAEFH